MGLPTTTTGFKAGMISFPPFSRPVLRCQTRKAPGRWKRQSGEVDRGGDAPKMPPSDIEIPAGDLMDAGFGEGFAPQKNTSLEKLKLGLLFLHGKFGEVFPWFLRRCFFSPWWGCHGVCGNFVNRIHCPSWPTNEGVQLSRCKEESAKKRRKKCKLFYFSRKAGGRISMFKKFFVSFSSKGTFLKIKPKLFVCLMVTQTLALDKELSTIHKTSHVMIFVYLLSELCVLLLLGIPYAPPCRPCPKSLHLYLVKTWNVSNFCRLQQLLLLGPSLPWCIQEIGDVNAMKAAYLNDEQIVKAPGSGSCFFSKMRFNLGRTWRYKWWEKHRNFERAGV